MQTQTMLTAEVGCNHLGAMETAQKMITTAARFCKVDVVKFQKRTVKELLTPDEYRAPHPNAYHAYGDTYGAHREFLEFDQEQHRQLKQWCEAAGVIYSTSVWDLTAAREMAALQPRMLKVPSAANLDIPMIQWLAEHYRGELHISLGMTRRTEENQIVKILEAAGRLDQVVMYACTSGYPVPFEDICLLEIERLKTTYGQQVKAIGFSGHHLGFAADIAALALGATCFERHFTLDRTWRGTDHAASLEPDGLRRLARDILNVQLALTPKSSEILPIEVPHRKKLKRCAGSHTGLKETG
ncbi:MAG: N-acetylneuraminate synthase [Desulfobacterales bacterium]|nr:N-acetylneuraminate synthase [Desulfobacterales bacterium]